MATTVTLVHVRVVKGKAAQFIEETLKNHRDSIQEPGNLRFDILQDPEDEHSFILYEMYENEQAARAHKETAHYLSWREGVAELMAEPRKGVPYTVLAPQVDV